MTTRRTLLIRAASEFVVIVLGVLVALAVDQWVNDRQDRSSELRYLEALEVELRQDSLVFVDILMANLREADQALMSVRPVAQGLEAFPQDTVAFLQTVLESSFSISSFPVSGVSFETIVATGDFQVIGSDALRTLLTAYYAEKRLNETLIREDDAGFRELVRGYVPPSRLGGESPEGLIREFGVQAAAEVVRSEGFLVGLNSHTSYVRASLSRLEPIPVQLGSLLQDLEAEVRRLR